MKDSDYIKLTFDLAQKAMGHTWPNPLVGAVIVKDGRIIGQGFHHQAGLDHAEVDAIKNATESVEGATIYVNLEPCCHTNKRTPPCAQRLIQEKFKRVVICNLDPNPNVLGQGIKLLEEAGIEVVHGILKEEGEKLNRIFFYNQRKNLSYVHLKLATTLDGKIALKNGESKWITSEKSREHVQLLRSHYQAIMVGAETVRADNPRLNVRLENFTLEQPFRVIVTDSGKLPHEAKVFNDEFKHRTLIYTKNQLSFDFPSDQVIHFEKLEDILKDLYQRKIINVFLEGGATLATNFLKENLVQSLSYFINPSFLGEGRSALKDLGVTQLEKRPQLKNTKIQIIDTDIFISGDL